MIESGVSHNKPSGYSYFVATDFSGVYAGEYPMWTWSESQGREKLAQYLNFGIRCFLDLTQAGEMPPYQQFLPAGCHRFSFPIVNGGIPSDVESVVNLFQQLETHLASTKDRLYIHCVGGVGRTGTIVACYYVYFIICRQMMHWLKCEVIMPPMNELRGCRHLRHNHSLTIYSSSHQPITNLFSEVMTQ